MCLLDADFVKNTIIQSMADEDLPIDLQTYRRLVTDFEREYDEIDCWFKQTRDGNYPVRQQALKIAEQGRRIVALDQQLLDVWRMLNHAVAESEQKIPFLEAEAAEVKTNIEKERTHEKELTTEYDKDRDALNQELGGKKGKLKEITQTRKDFEELGIEEKLALAAREESIKQEKSTILPEGSWRMPSRRSIMHKRRLIFRSKRRCKKNANDWKRSAQKTEML